MLLATNESNAASVRERAKKRECPPAESIDSSGNGGNAYENSRYRNDVSESVKTVGNTAKRTRPPTNYPWVGVLIGAVTVFLILGWLFFWVKSLEPTHDLLGAVGTWLGPIVVIVGSAVAIGSVYDTRAANRATAFLGVMDRYNLPQVAAARKAVLGTDRPEPPTYEQQIELCRFYEQVGTLVRYGGIDFRITHSYLRSRCIKAYVKLRPFISQERQRSGNRNAWMYFEYLALRCIAHAPVEDRYLESLRNMLPEEKVSAFTGELVNTYGRADII